MAGRAKAPTPARNGTDTPLPAMGLLASFRTLTIRREVEAKKKAAEATEELKIQETDRKKTIEEVRQKMEQATGQIVTQEEALKALADGSFVASQGVRLSFDEQKTSYDELGNKINENKEIIKTHGEVTTEVASLEMELSAVKLAAEKGNIEEIINTIRLSAADRKAIQEASATELLGMIAQNNEQIKFLEEQKAATQDENERKGWQSAIDTAAEKGKLLTDEYQKTNSNIEGDQTQHYITTLENLNKSLDEELVKVKDNKIEEQRVLSGHYAEAKRQLSDYATKYAISTEGYTEEGYQTLSAHVRDMETKYGIHTDAMISDTQQMGTGMKREMGNAGRGGTNELQFELDFARPYVKSTLGRVGTDGTQGFKENFNGNSLGRNAVEGIASGLADKIEALKTWGANLAKAVNGAFKAALDINSPSRVMRKDGRNAGEGAVLGVADMIPKMIATASKLANSFREPFEDGHSIEIEPEINIPEKFFGVGIDSAKEFAKGFSLQLDDALRNIQTSIIATLVTATPRLATSFAGGYGSGQTVDNSKTVTNAPVIHINGDTNSPAAIGRKVNQIMTFGLAGDR